ncbi:MAG: histidinol-phosphate aminotransferase [Frankiaceae bacterium]|nr:histidinol-phosphate aminotransferase [Frankiaceae bacterium]
MTPPELNDLPIRDDLRGLSPYGAPQLDVPVRLNTNENPYHPPDALVADLAQAVAAAATTLNRYPDREARELRDALAAYLGHGLTGDQLWAANGSNEVLQQVLQAFGGPGRRAMGFEPSYAMYRLYSLATATGWVAADPEVDYTFTEGHMVAAVERARPDVVFVTRPNNPTGSSVALGVVRAIYEAAPGMVVVDEAYQEFSAEPSALELLPGRPRLIVSRTMSKAFALAGGRVGYLAADRVVVDALRLVRLPYHLSSLTQAAALAALRHADATLADVKRLIDERERVTSGLRAMGLTVVPSDSNFLLYGRFPDQSAVWQRLLERGVLVRDVHVAGWLRVTIGLPHENDTFLAAMAAVDRG